MVVFQNNQQHQEKIAMQKSDCNINYTQNMFRDFKLSEFEKYRLFTPVIK